jgi:hypothetical protein
MKFAIPDLMETPSTWFEQLSRGERKELLTMLHVARRFFGEGIQSFNKMLKHLEDEHETYSSFPPSPSLPCVPPNNQRRFTTCLTL